MTRTKQWVTGGLPALHVHHLGCLLWQQGNGVKLANAAESLCACLWQLRAKDLAQAIVVKSENGGQEHENPWMPDERELAQ
jgi:hypothetical protein